MNKAIMHKKIIFILIMLTSLITWLVSCTKQSADKIVAVTDCDTSAVKYAADIVPILQANCYRCHASENNGGSGGIILEGYNNLTMWANNGYLIGNVTHAPGYIPMPYDMPILTNCELNKIVAWVNQGALNN
jgi:uncharacterized membrane protein